MDASRKKVLSAEELADVIDLVLWAGQMLLQSGARAQRIEETVHHLGTGLGADWLDIFISPHAISITTVNHGQFRTKIRRVVQMGANMNVAVEINELSRQVTAGTLSHQQLRQQLEQIDQLPPVYNRWFVIVAIGLACAAASRLFGGDWVSFGVTWVAAMIAMWVRQELVHRSFNPFVGVVMTAFVAAFVAGSSQRVGLTGNPQVILVSSVLMLIPGVPLITSGIDAIEGNVIMGLARGVLAALTSLSIALGLLLATWLLGMGV